MLLGTAGPALSTPADEDALRAYVRARAADVAGAEVEASHGYAAALALAPGNDVLAARALSEGISAGDETLALAAARALDKAGKLTPDGRILLAADALKAGRWDAADAQVEKLAGDEVFSFSVPIIRAWIAIGSGKGDPLLILAGTKGNGLGQAYAPEQRALILLATGKTEEGMAALQPLLKDGSIHSARLRVAAASVLAAKGARAAAQAMVAGDAATLVRARQLLAANGRLGGAIGTPAAGVADLLLRVSVDLNAQQVPELALSFARIATFLAPQDAEAQLLTAELLSGRNRAEEALAALARVPADDPLADNATERRLAILADAGRKDEAIALARAATAKQPDSLEAWLRLGDVLTQTENFAAAGDAFGHALALAGPDGKPGHPRWTMLLLQGNALTQAGQWKAAKTALEEAYRLAPHEAVVLNYLGYSQLERRENVGEAERLIREASRLQPDDSSITDSLGWALYIKGDLPEAVSLLERAAQGQPADPSINEHLGDAYYAVGRHYEARYAWRAALVYADAKASTRLRSKIDTGLRPDLTAP